MKPSDLLKTLSVGYPARVPFFLQGPPGVGKSQVVRQAAQAMGLQLLTIQAQTHDISDVNFPIVDVANRSVHWVNSLFPCDPNWEGIVFIDEWDKCAPLLQTAFLEVTLERKIGEYSLPDGAWIVGAGNRAQDRTASHTLISALRDRMILFDFHVSMDDWYLWAVTNNIDLHVRTFVHKVRPDLLHKFDPQQPKSPTPRGWEFVSKLYHLFPPELQFEVVKGSVGESTSAEFTGYLKIAQHIPDVDAILASPMTAPVPANMPHVLWAVCGSIADRVRKPQNGQADNAWRYACRLPDEFSALLGRDIVAVNPHNLASHQATPWLAKHGEVIRDLAKRK